MKSILLLSFWFLASSSAQFNLPFDADCAAGRFIDSYLVPGLKSKYPKKFGSKFDYGKDLGLERKLNAVKLLARHMKNLNALNYDFQNLMYQQQQQALMQQSPFAVPDQAALLAQQAQLPSLHNPFDPARGIYAAQVDPQLAALAQVPDQRYQQQGFQQPTYQLTAAQSLTSLRPQHPAYQNTVPVHM